MFQREAKIFTEVGGRMEAKDITERGSEINRDIRGEINSRLARAHLLAFLIPLSLTLVCIFIIWLLIYRQAANLSRHLR